MMLRQARQVEYCAFAMRINTSNIANLEEKNIKMKYYVTNNNRHFDLSEAKAQVLTPINIASIL